MNNVSIIENLPEQEYHARKSLTTVSKSQLVYALKSALHFKDYTLSEGKEPTLSMIKGTVLHEIMLNKVTPNQLEKLYAIIPEGIDMRTKAGKEWKADNEGKPIIKTEDVKDCMRMAFQIALDEFSIRLFTAKGRSELSVFVYDEEHDLTRAIRVDRLPNEGSVVVDLKTSMDASPEGFERAVRQFRYDMQAAYYLDTLAMAGIKRTGFIFVVVENQAPFATANYILSEEKLEIGRQDYKRALKVVAEANATGEYKGYGDGLKVIEAKGWELNKLEEIEL
jgi:exodeoxyribonuclease VIII